MDYAVALGASLQADHAFAATFLLPVLKFLCGQLAQLGAPERERLVHLLSAALHVLGNAAVQSAGKTAGVATGKRVICQLLGAHVIELPLLAGALEKVRTLAANGKIDAAVNLAGWLRQNQRLFAPLPHGVFTQLFDASCGDLSIANVEVDAAAALAELASVPPLATLDALFSSNAPSLAIAVESPLFECWKVLKGPAHPACQFVLLQAAAKAAEAEPATLARVARAAHDALRVTQPQPQQALALFKALLQTIVSAAKGPFMTGWAAQYLEEIAKDAALLAKMKALHPNAGAWVMAAQLRVLAGGGKRTADQLILGFKECLAATVQQDDFVDAVCRDLIDLWRAGETLKYHAVALYAAAAAAGKAPPLATATLVQMAGIASFAAASGAPAGAALVLLVTALAKADADAALREFARVCRLPAISMVAPTLKPMLGLALAEHFTAIGDRERATKAFAQAQAAVPCDDAWRLFGGVPAVDPRAAHELQSAFAAFMARAKEKFGGEWT